MLTILTYTLLLLALSAANPQTGTGPETGETKPWWLTLQDTPQDTPQDDPVPKDPIVEENAPSTRTGESPPSSVQTGGDGLETRFDRKNNCERTPGWECVPYYACDDVQNVITDGAGLFDIRTGASDPDCPLNLEVCCRIGFINRPDQLPPTPVVENACGTRHESGIHVRLTGLQDFETQFGEFPWMVAILKYEKIGQKEINLFICGGSLIKYDVVLTAAHCVYSYGDRPNLKIRAGEWDTQLDSEIYHHVDAYVSRVINHPEFNSGSLINDVALIKLKTPFPRAPHISTICLPPPHLDIHQLSCFATGWGKDEFDGNFQNVMKKVPLKLNAHLPCQKALQKTRLGKHFQLHNSFVCAGGELGIDTCKGDGGSPLVCRPDRNPHDPQGHLYFQVGIVAWGIGCGEDSIPGVYASVPELLGWVNEAVHTISA